MTEQAKTGGRRHDSRLRLMVWGGAVLLWLLPLMAMQFTDEVAWSGMDFVIWAAMLLIAASLVEVALRLSGSLSYRAGAVVAVGASFLLVWVNLAVGIIGDEDNPLNQMFFVVLLVGVVGAFVANFRAPGMVRVMIAMAAVQVLIGIAALIMGHVVVLLTFFWVTAWALSAWLFNKAARDEAGAVAAGEIAS